MNQKGEASLFCVLSIVVLSGLLTLCALDLQKSFGLLKKRTHLFLCVKETKGELHRYLELTGKTNWAIKNINKAKFVMLLIPGLQGAAMNADKARKALISYQNFMLLSYLKNLKDLKARNCPLDPRAAITPFKFAAGYERDVHGAVQLRSIDWTYIYSLSPYLLTVKVDASKWESLRPEIKYMTGEKEVKWSSLFSSRF